MPITEEERKEFDKAKETLEIIRFNLELVEKEIAKGKTYLIIFLLLIQLMGIPIITQVIKMLLEGN